MDFSWSKQQVEIYERTLRFAREHLNGSISRREPLGQFGQEEWTRCGEMGLLKLCVPESEGGLGLDALTTARAMEALARGCEDTGLVFSLAAHLFACVMPIAEYGSAELKARLLPGLADGRKIAANAITEAGAGSDVFALRTEAVREGDEYVVTGEKTYATNGPIADVFVVYAMTNAAHGYFGVSAFVVERGMHGLTTGKAFDKIGLTTAPTGSVYLDGCRVPAANRLADDGQGALVFERSMHWERSCLFAAYLGVMDRQLERVLTYARERRQFGKSIGEHQAIAHRIADMKIRLESARLLLYRACWLHDRGQDATLDISLAKVAVSEAAVQSAFDAIRIHGGNGVVREYGVERDLRDAIPSTIFSGTSEIQRSIVARALGL